MFVRDSLLKVFEGDHNITTRIRDKIDPGEYGLESWLCRWICIVILGFQLQGDINAMFNLLHVVWKIPRFNQAWLVHKGCASDEDSHGLDDVAFRVRGMSLAWKAFVVALVVAPRANITFNALFQGTKYLLWTASIEELILNSLAITFILGLDDVFFKALSTNEMFNLLDKLEPWVHIDDNPSCPKLILMRLEHFVGVTSCCLVSIWYFWNYCILTADGSLVSKPLYPELFGGWWEFLPSPFLMFTTYPNATWCPPPELGAGVECQLR